MLSAGVMFVGSVTSSIWTPLPKRAVTAAYVWLPDLNVVMLFAPSSSRLMSSSVMWPTAVMFGRSVTFSIWTPSSFCAATAAYVWPPDSNVVMPNAPLSSRLLVFVMLPAGVMFGRSVIFSIWTPLSDNAATAAYM